MVIAPGRVEELNTKVFTETSTLFIPPSLELRVFDSLGCCGRSVTLRGERASLGEIGFEPKSAILNPVQTRLGSEAPVVAFSRANFKSAPIPLVDGCLLDSDRVFGKAKKLSFRVPSGRRLFCFEKEGWKGKGSVIDVNGTSVDAAKSYYVWGRHSKEVVVSGTTYDDLSSSVRAVLGAGTYNDLDPALLSANTSLLIPAGYEIVFYEKTGARGKSMNYSHSAEFIWDGFSSFVPKSAVVKRKISSRTTSRIKAFAETNWKGTSVSFDDGLVPDVAATKIGSGLAHSFRIPSGKRLICFRDKDCEGECISFTGDQTWDIADSKSLYIWGGNSTHAFLFNGCYWKGKAKASRINPGEIQKVSSQFNPVTALVPDGFELRLYDQVNATGRCCILRGAAMTSGRLEFKPKSAYLDKAGILPKRVRFFSENCLTGDAVAVAPDGKSFALEQPVKSLAIPEGLMLTEIKPSGLKILRSDQSHFALSKGTTVLCAYSYRLGCGEDSAVTLCTADADLSSWILGLQRTADITDLPGAKTGMEFSKLILPGGFEVSLYEKRDFGGRVFKVDNFGPDAYRTVVLKDWSRKPGSLVVSRSVDVARCSGGAALSLKNASSDRSQAGVELSFGKKVLKRGRWVHVAAVFSGGKITRFLNGRNIGDGSLPAVNKSSNHVFLASNGFMGSIGMLSIHSAARDEQSIAKGRFYFPDESHGSDLQVLWNFDSSDVYNVDSRDKQKSSKIGVTSIVNGVKSHFSSYTPYVDTLIQSQFHFIDTEFPADPLTVGLGKHLMAQSEAKAAREKQEAQRNHNKEIDSANRRAAATKKSAHERALAESAMASVTEVYGIVGNAVNVVDNQGKPKKSFFPPNGGFTDGLSNLLSAVAVSESYPIHMVALKSFGDRDSQTLAVLNDGMDFLEASLKGSLGGVTTGSKLNIAACVLDQQTASMAETFAFILMTSGDIYATLAGVQNASLDHLYRISPSADPDLWTLAFDSKRKCLYVGDGRSILAIDLTVTSTGVSLRSKAKEFRLLVSSAKSPMPTAMTVDDITGDVYWVDGKLGLLRKMTQGGTQIQNLYHIQTCRPGLAIDPVLKRIYWCGHAKNIRSGLITQVEQSDEVSIHTSRIRLRGAKWVAPGIWNTCGLKDTPWNHYEDDSGEGYMIWFRADKDGVLIRFEDAAGNFFQVSSEKKALLFTSCFDGRNARFEASHSVFPSRWHHLYLQLPKDSPEFVQYIFDLKTNHYQTKLPLRKNGKWQKIYTGCSGGIWAFDKGVEEGDCRWNLDDVERNHGGFEGPLSIQSCSEKFPSDNNWVGFSSAATMKSNPSNKYFTTEWSGYSAGQSSPSPSGQVLNFDGKGSYAISEDFLLKGARDLTVEVWLRCRDLKKESVVFDVGEVNGVTLSVGNTGQIIFSNRFGDQAKSLSGHGIWARDWFHIIVRVAFDGEAEIFINGASIACGQIGTLGEFQANAFIGRSRNGDVGFFNGQIAYLRAWNFCFSDNEVRQSGETDTLKFQKQHSAFRQILFSGNTDGTAPEYAHFPFETDGPLAIRSKSLAAHEKALSAVAARAEAERKASEMISNASAEAEQQKTDAHASLVDAKNQAAEEIGNARLAHRKKVSDAIQRKADAQSQASRKVSAANRDAKKSKDSARNKAAKIKDEANQKKKKLIADANKRLRKAKEERAKH